MHRYSFEVAIFNLEEVIVKTVSLHYETWKSVLDEYLHFRESRNNEPFDEFTYDDYLVCFNGKSRYQGVRNFLKSRRIQIPLGDLQDDPDKETMWAIANKENLRFCEILKSQGVKLNPSSIQFIKNLKKAGVRIGLASSSENGKFIFEIAGVEELFDTKVYGEVASKNKLQKKSEENIFVTASYILGSLPAKAIVIEDVPCQIETIRNSGFGLVIGLAKENNESEVAEHGADVVVHDLSQITLEWIEQWFHKRPLYLFDFWDHAPKRLYGLPEEGTIIINPYYLSSAKDALLGKKKIVFFLDYDGTLTPIVDRPEQALLSLDMRNVVERLLQRYTTAIISGRLRSDVEKLVGIKGLFYAGSHGFDISGKGISMVEPRAKKAIPLISKITKQLSKNLQGIPQILIEEKKFSVAVHYRLVEEKYLPKIKDFVDSIIQHNDSLRLMCGKKVFEILPAIDWDKGKAVQWIMGALRISFSSASVVYIGDDTTDEDAFRIVRTRGRGILVSSHPKESTADFRLSNPQEVKKLFEEII